MTPCIESARTPGNEYPKLEIAGKTLTESRVVWAAANGPIPDGLWVLHECDNPRCINLDHLFVGTPKDNTQDSMKKGRHVGATQQAKTHCPQGHEFDEANTYMHGGWRHCRACRRDYQRVKRAA